MCSFFASDLGRGNLQRVVIALEDHQRLQVTKVEGETGKLIGRYVQMLEGNTADLCEKEFTNQNCT